MQNTISLVQQLNFVSNKGLDLLDKPLPKVLHSVYQFLASCVWQASVTRAWQGMGFAMEEAIEYPSRKELRRLAYLS
ncbi:unnamed protein product [Cylindrotheca closterium]|uniref:Uncharacterized protein n=1 Tax=Cylindrotheca closterium TaxID=2856 RepID=A0AAD2G104_9STRA|nr:unnamed protein product [Cylindrotheca closterium]